MVFDIIIFALGCIYLVNAVVLKLTIHRILACCGIFFILLSIVSFCLLPALRIIEAVCILVLLLYSLLNLIVYCSGKKASLPQVICVLGARVWGDCTVGRIFRNRLNHAFNLHHKFNEKPSIAVCGAAGTDEPVSEAKAGADYLISKGISPDKVIMEPDSFNTIESLRNLSDILPDKNLPVLISTSNWGMLRASWIAKKAGLNAKISGARSTFPEYMSYCLYEILAIGYNLFINK